MYFKIWIYDIQDITPMEGNPIYNEAIDKLSAWDHINWTHIKIWKNVFGKASSTIFFMFFKFLFHPEKKCYSQINSKSASMGSTNSAKSSNFGMKSTSSF